MNTSGLCHHALPHLVEAILDLELFGQILLTGGQLFTEIGNQPVHLQNNSFLALDFVLELVDVLLLGPQPLHDIGDVLHESLLLLAAVLQSVEYVRPFHYMLLQITDFFLQGACLVGIVRAYDLASRVARGLCAVCLQFL